MFNEPFIPVMFTIAILVGFFALYGVVLYAQARADKRNGKSYPDNSNQ